MNQVSERKSEAADLQSIPSSKSSLYNNQSQNQNANAGNEKKNDCRVQVAVRVRPFINKELVDCESSCVKTTNNKIVIGADKDFEFDKVIDQEASQEEVYGLCVNELLEKSFEGYNATVLAYGQTGSGKTYTMGTSNISLNDVNDMGILPRVIREIFSIRREREKQVEMILKLSYFEIYNDNIIDLLDPNTIAGANNAANSKKGKTGPNNTNNVFIREEQDGSINLYGITEEKVNSPEEMLAALERGGLCRSTSATLMNQTSSRSHAVFTIFLEQHTIEDLYQNNDDNAMVAEDSEGKKNADALINEGFKTSKFHFVDLAGSERIKKTGAVGNTLKEGININMGLLSLGNVISALTEPQKSGAHKKHIPYRDSKLTRILQDSLGGNSNTLMIACVSPAESNFEESLNTLKYASRARRIKNKPVVNRDPQSALISSLKQQVQEAHLEISKYRQLLTQNNIKIPDGMMTIGGGQNFGMNDDNNQKRRISQDLLMLKQGNVTGNTILQMGMSNEADMEELKQLRLNQVKLEKRIKELQAENGSLKSHSYKGEIDILIMQRERDEFRLKLEKLIQVSKEKGIFLQYTQGGNMEIESENRQSEQTTIQLNSEGEPEIQIDLTQRSLIDEYCENAEKLKKDLMKKDKEYRELQIEFEDGIKASLRDQQMLVEREKKINVLTRNFKNKEIEIKKMKEEILNLKKQATVRLPIVKSSNKMQIEEGATQKGKENDEDASYNQETSFYQNEEEEDDDLIDADELEKISQDPEFVKMESQLKLDENQKKLRLSKVDGSIFEKSEEFRKLNQNQLELQKQLLEKMKEQYHQKINHLETDMKKMENQRDEALQKLSHTNTKEAVQEKQRVIESFKQKVTDMQGTLNEFKRKAREQETLSKTVQVQEKQIQQLGVEINKFKQLKTNLYKEMKKNNEEFEKYKQKKYKDLMQEKKKNIEKEKQIFKLQNQTKKQERLLQKKQEEFKKMMRSRDLIKKIISTSNQTSQVKGVRGKMASFKGSNKQKVDSVNQQDQNITLNTSLNTSTNLVFMDNLSDFQVDEALDMCLCKLIESIEIQLNVEKAEEELKITFQELEEVQQKSIEFKLNLEKRERALSEGGIIGKNKEDQVLGEELMEQQQQQLYQQRMELEEMLSRLESLEAKYEFKKEKINKLYNDKRSSNFETLQNDLLTSQKYNNLQTQKIFVKYLFEKFGYSSAEILRNQERIDMLHLQIDDSNQFIKILQNQKDICQIQMQSQIDSLQQALQTALTLHQSQSQPDPSDSDSEINQTQDEHNLSLNLVNHHHIIGEDGRRFNKNKGSPPKQIASNRYKSMRLAHQTEQSPFKKDNKNSEDFVKLQQKQINDLTKQLKQNEIRVKTLQNRNETLQQKYDDLKKATCKDKFIGISKQNADEDLLSTNQTGLNTTTNSQQSQQQSQQHLNNNMIHLQQLSIGTTAQVQNNSQSISTPGSQNNALIAGQNTYSQQIQQLNNVKTSKEVANIQSLKDRRREVKGKVGANDGTPQNNTTVSAQLTPPLPSHLNQLTAQQQGELKPLNENKEESHLSQQYQILDRVTNNEPNVSGFGFQAKAKAHSLAQKRNLLQEARQKQHTINSQLQLPTLQISQQLQQPQVQSFGVNLQTDFSARGRVSTGIPSRQENQLQSQAMVTEVDSQSQNKNHDIPSNTSSDNTYSQPNSLQFNLGSPLKVQEVSQPLIVDNGFSLADSEDLTGFNNQQNQVQGSAGSINRILNEVNQQGSLSLLQNSTNMFMFSNDNNGQTNCLNNSQTLIGLNGSGLRNSIESNPTGIHSPGEETPFACKYECAGKINDAHTGQVFCVESHENFLFSTSVRTLKIWDLETLKCISDISAHTHFVKGLAILEQEKWIATACDKYINIWDMISLQKVCTLTGHNVDIKQLYVDGHHTLYSAGKGLNNYGALVTWDIRKQQVIDEREKNQDIFSVLPYNNVIYYASRDHYVRRINMETNQSIDPFKPPHYDAVTSLAILNGYLVSGSKDHNLKLWNTNPSNTSFKQQTYYSNEQLMCLESNKDKNLLYVGQKDGKIKVVTTQHNKFRDVSDINNGLQSVNCITNIQNSASENVFACGTADKIIKIWKPTQESQYNLQQLKNLTSNSNSQSENNNNYFTSAFQPFQQGDQNNESMEAE